MCELHNPPLPYALLEPFQAPYQGTGGLHSNHFLTACSPSHNCKKCEQEDGAPGKGALIPCARCPISYHLDCMPEPVLSSQKKRVWLNKPGELREHHPTISVLRRHLSVHHSAHHAFCACGQAVSCCVLQGMT